MSEALLYFSFLVFTIFFIHLNFIMIGHIDIILKYFIFKAPVVYFFRLLPTKINLLFEILYLFN